MTGKEILVVCVAAPLLVGLAVSVASLKIEYSFFTKTLPDLKTEARQTVEKLESNSVTAESPPAVESDLGELPTLLKLADKVYGPTPRNAELQKIVALALEEGKPGFALQAADKLYGPTPRNEQFMIVLNKCIELKKFDLALKAADLLYGPTARNEAFKKIIDAGIKLRGRKDS